MHKQLPASLGSGLLPASLKEGMKVGGRPMVAPTGSDGVL